MAGVCVLLRRGWECLVVCWSELFIDIFIVDHVERSLCNTPEPWRVANEGRAEADAGDAGVDVGVGDVPLDVRGGRANVDWHDVIRRVIDGEIVVGGVVLHGVHGLRRLRQKFERHVRAAGHALAEASHAAPVDDSGVFGPCKGTE